MFFISKIVEGVVVPIPTLPEESIVNSEAADIPPPVPILNLSLSLLSTPRVNLFTPLKAKLIIGSPIPVLSNIRLVPDCEFLIRTSPPSTWSVWDGEVVPIPTLPEESTLSLAVLAVNKLRYVPFLGKVINDLSTPTLFPLFHQYL